MPLRFIFKKFDIHLLLYVFISFLFFLPFSIRTNMDHQLVIFNDQQSCYSFIFIVKLTEKLVTLLFWYCNFIKITEVGYSWDKCCTNNIGTEISGEFDLCWELVYDGCSFIEYNLMHSILIVLIRRYFL